MTINISFLGKPVLTTNHKTVKDITADVKVPKSGGKGTIPGLVETGRPATTLISLTGPCVRVPSGKGLRGGAPPSRPRTRIDTILENSRALRARTAGAAESSNNNFDPEDALSDTGSEKTRSWLRKTPAKYVKGEVKGKFLVTTWTMF